MLNLKGRNPELGTTRLEAFTDGVFAIAITLLILEVKIPSEEDLVHSGGLYQYLLHLWPSYLSYVISFFVIGVYWSNSHWLFTYVFKKTNHVFNLMAILFLMTIAFLPFTTAILGDFILDEDHRNAAITVYCIGYFLPTPMALLGLRYASTNKRLIDQRLSEAFMRKLFIQFRFAMILQIAAIAFSFQYPKISLAIVAVNLLLYFIPPEMPVYDEHVA